MATTSKDKTTDAILIFKNLSRITTEKDIVDFLGVMVECYFEKTVDGVLTGKCYVNIRDKKLAKEALKKSGECILGSKVKIKQSSKYETVASFQKVTPSKTIRITPFGKGEKYPEIVKAIKKDYDSVSTVQVYTSNEYEITEFKYAIVTFNSEEAAETAMKSYITNVENNPQATGMTKAGKRVKGKTIEEYMKNHPKELFWVG